MMWDTFMFLPAEIADAIRLNKLDEKWGVDSEALQAKIRALTPTGLAALTVATARFWRETNLPTGEALRQVGLIKNP